MSNRSPKCCMCGTYENDDLNLGEMKHYKGYHAHYYCLLLSTCIIQSGADNEGILGFLPEDIRNEVSDSKRRVCHYCKEPGASVLCDNSKCKLAFHLPCGLRNNTSHQFLKEFKSFCHIHRLKQTFPKPKESHSCTICYEVIDFSGYDVLWAPCCKKRSFFHRACLQQMALSAGYFFKCPICNDSETFQTTMKRFGVFIPDRDASWELEPNAFRELLYRHNECNVKVCQSKKGRKYSNKAGPWTMVLCGSCGSQGTHVICSNLKKSRKWVCYECTAISAKLTTSDFEAIPSTSGIQNNQNSTSASNGPSANTNVVPIAIPSTSRNCPEMTSANTNAVPIAIPSTSRNCPEMTSANTNAVPIAIPSTSRNCPEIPFTIVENKPGSRNGSSHGRKRKRKRSAKRTVNKKAKVNNASRNSTERPNCTDTSRNSTERPNCTDTSTSFSLSPNPIVIDSDSDVAVIEQEGPAFKCLLANDGKILPVRAIEKQDVDFLVQGDLNIKEEPKPVDGLKNIKISNVRSLHEPTPPPPRLLTGPPPLTPSPNYLIRMNNGERNDKRIVIPNNGNGENMFLYSYDAEKNGKNAVNLIDNEGNVFVFKPIDGYELTKTDRKVIEDQNNQNAGNLNNNTSDVDVVIID